MNLGHEEVEALPSEPPLPRRLTRTSHDLPRAYHPLPDLHSPRREHEGGGPEGGEPEGKEPGEGKGGKEGEEKKEGKGEEEREGEGEPDSHLKPEGVG